MNTKRDIKFTTSPSKSRLSEGNVRYQGQIRHNEVRDVHETRKRFAEYLNTRETLANFYLDGLESFIADEIAKGNALRFGPFSVGLKMRGSLPASNAPFDEEANAIAVELTPAKSIKKATSRLKPVNATLDERCVIRCSAQMTPYEIMDAMVSDGERTLHTHGSALEVHSSISDEGIWIENDLGVKLLSGDVFESTYSNCEATFTGHIDPGLYWLVISSRITPDGERLQSRRRITIL